MKKILFSLFLTFLSTTTAFAQGGLGGFFSPRPQFLVTDGTCSAGFCTNDPTIACDAANNNAECKANFIDSNIWLVYLRKLQILVYVKNWE